MFAINMMDPFEKRNETKFANMMFVRSNINEREGKAILYFAVPMKPFFLSGRYRIHGNNCQTMKM